MKALLTICLLVSATFVWAADNKALVAPAASVVQGEVLEVQDVESYTYLRLKTANGETWAAIMKTPMKTGDAVTLENVTVMSNFESKTLKKTFPTILFGSLAGAAATGAPASSAMGAMTGAASGKHGMSSAYPIVPAKKLDTINDEHVSKAKGENAQTVADVVTKSAKLKDKTVLVRGKVVKYNAEIMDKNWVHLRDGSGSAEKDTNDILVTTASKTKVGDIVTFKGTVRTDKDFGSGYSYKVLIEEATLQ
jgi:hypothetical protein